MIVASLNLNLLLLVNPYIIHSSFGNHFFLAHFNVTTVTILSKSRHLLTKGSSSQKQLSLYEDIADIGSGNDDIKKTP